MKTKNQESAEVRKAIKQVNLQTAELLGAAAMVMTPGLVKPARFTLTLGEEIDFEFGPRAFYRMGTLDRPFELADCTAPMRAYAASVAWLWACLDQQDAPNFEEPEDLARVIPLERALECTKALIAAIAEYNSSRQAGAKAGREPVEKSGT
jgi:hypothetical protein